MRLRVQIPITKSLLFHDLLDQFYFFLSNLSLICEIKQKIEKSKINLTKNLMKDGFVRTDDRPVVIVLAWHNLPDSSM